MNKCKRFEFFISKEKKSLISGPFGSNISSKYFVKEGVPVIRGNNLTFDFQKFVDEGFVFISEEKAKELNCFAFPDDIVFTAAGTIGQVGLITSDLKYNYYTISNKQIRATLDNSKIDVRFAYFILNSNFVRNQILNGNTGSTIPLINLTTIKGILIPDFKLDTQKKIASILSALDDKIELNNKINAELEAMAKTIYDYWFVQFDFPDANGKPYKSSGGKMVWNEQLKREVPEGWEDISIECILAKESNSKKIPSSEYLTIGKFPIIDQSTQFVTGYTNDDNSIIHTTKPRIIFGDHTRVVKFINFNFARGADGTQVLLSNSNRMPQHLFYQVVSKIDLSNYGYARHFKFLKDRTIILPEESLAQKYDNHVKSYFDLIRQNRFQNQQLSQLRDWLLPMLMNGQVTVGDAYEKVEEVMNVAAEERVKYRSRK